MCDPELDDPTGEHPGVDLEQLRDAPQVTDEAVAAFIRGAQGYKFDTGYGMDINLPDRKDTRAMVASGLTAALAASPVETATPTAHLFERFQRGDTALCGAIVPIPPSPVPCAECERIATAPASSGEGEKPCGCLHSWDRHGPEAGGCIECECAAVTP